MKYCIVICMFFTFLNRQSMYPYIPTSKPLLQDVVIGLNYHQTVVFVDFNHSFILLNRFRTCISQLCYL